MYTTNYFFIPIVVVCYYFILYKYNFKNYVLLRMMDEMHNTLSLIGQLPTKAIVWVCAIWLHRENVVLFHSS